MTSMSTDVFEHEISLYIGIVSTSIIFGIYLGLLFVVIRMIMKNREMSMSRTTRSLYLVFEGVMLVLSSLAFICVLVMGEMVWIIHRDKPTSYYEKDGARDPWYLYLGALVQAISMFLGDALLIYRCHIIFGSRPWIVSIPAICSVGYLILSILNYASPTNKFDAIIPAQILMLVVNPMVTTMICIKIFTATRRTRKFLHFSKSYTNVSAILIESAAPWTILGILLTITFWINDAFWWEGLDVVWCAVGLLSPQLVILRVAMGVAWDKKTSLELTRLSTMAFSPPPQAVHHNTHHSGKFKPTAQGKHSSSTQVMSNPGIDGSPC